jgi:NAD(P)H-hydrate epimerase
MSLPDYFPKRIPHSSYLRAHESKWIEACGNNWGLVLMELAGKAAAEHVFHLWQKEGGQIVVLCGQGNNGGDGFVIARYLHLWQVPVSVYQIESTKEKASSARNESAINKSILQKLDLTINDINAGAMESLHECLQDAGVVVDALLGTGLDRNVEGLYKQAIEAANDSPAPIVAVDIPSGVNSDTGQVLGSAIAACETVTFGYLKSGLLCYPGAELAGQLHIVDIGLPNVDDASTDDEVQCWLSNANFVASHLPYRAADSNKGTFGNLLTIAGSFEFRGAAHLCGISGLRTGAGLSIVATAKSLIPSLPADEVIYKGIEETAAQSISSKAIEELTKQLEKTKSVVLGPGLSMDPDTVKFVHDFIKKLNKPSVIDADALNAIAKDTKVLPGDCRHFVFTPHPKELARLTGLTVEAIQANRLQAAHDAACKFNAIVVLKGAHTVIASPDNRLHINPTGNAGMATAGSGDVLSGIIGALLAQGLEPFEAAICGVYLHGAAGDLAAEQLGDAGLVAGDIASMVPRAIAQITSGQYVGSQLEKQLLELSTYEND